MVVSERSGGSVNARRISEGASSRRAPFAGSLSVEGGVRRCLGGVRRQGAERAEQDRDEQDEAPHGLAFTNVTVATTGGLNGA